MNPQEPQTPQQQPPAVPKPVAYDQYGQPLYAHPPAPLPSAQPQPASEQSAAEGKPNPQVVYMTRAVDPHEQKVSPEIKAKHDESMKRYPQLNLSDGEFVMSAIKRHPIGLVSIWGVVVAAVLVIFVGFPLLLSSGSLLGGENLSTGAIMSGGIVLLLAAVLFVLGGIIATVIYQANRFYLTNESVIQHIQTSLFSKKDQTISLANIEDASYRQHGLLQTLLNYGSIRLSTEGEETTYRFNFVAKPKTEIDRLNNAVEGFKNFRPVGNDD
ncbi:MAG: PH domain-containing protein [Candidatus Saccharimonadales bacterium]